MSKTNKAKKIGDKTYEVIAGESSESVAVTCPFCENTYIFRGVSRSDVCDTSRNIQDIFPDLEPEWREMFISNMCPNCWKKTFGDD